MFNNREEDEMEQKRWLTPTQRVLDGLSILICLGTVIYLAVAYKGLPQQIPSHYDAAGNVTGYQGKSMLIVLGFIMVFVITLPLSVLVRVRKLYTVMNTPWPIPKGQEGRIAALTKDFLCVTNLFMTVMFAGIMLCSTQGWKPGVFVWLPILLLTVALVAFLVKTKRACKAPKDIDPWET